MKDITRLVSSLLGVSLGSCLEPGPTLHANNIDFSCGFGLQGLPTLISGTPLDGADYLQIAPGGISLGVACSSVKDKVSCENQLRQIQSASELPYTTELRRAPILIVERGGVFESFDLLRFQESFEVNTSRDAALYAFLSGYQVCAKETMVSQRGSSYWIQLGIEGAHGGCSNIVEKIQLSEDKKLSLRDVSGGLCVGRRPQGLDERGRLRPTSLGALFADIAWQELASAPAFLLLCRNLAAHKAPEGLQRRSLVAASDEVRHAALASMLARRFGATPMRVCLERSATPSLFEMARENMLEGCINETFSALLACYQAATATDPQIAHVMRSVSRDELRHAQLSHDIAEWLTPQLSSREQAALHDESRAALSSLIDDAVALSDEDLSSSGYPSLETRQQLASAFREAV